MEALVHFKNFFGPGTLCRANVEAGALTACPDKVTCPRCLTMMGRAGRRQREDLAAERNRGT